MADGRTAAALRDLLGPEGCLDHAAALRVYARDASHLELGRPAAVALPRTPAEAAAVVGRCAEMGVPWTARGAGTGLSGGALPADGWVVVSTARMTDVRILGDHAVRAGPGVTNAALDRLLAPRGGVFAPDPSSQEAATVGGNVAENAGGPHCLKVGNTVQHVRGLTWVDADGTLRATGAGVPGWDLTPLFTGSEGTLGLVVEAELVVSPLEPAAATLLAYVDDLELSARAVVELLASGLLPAALEVVDGVMLGVVEEAFAFGFRTDAAAAMIVEFTGTEDEVRHDAARAADLLRSLGAEVHEAADEARRLDLWRCRKRAFGAVGRLSPNYVTMDVAVPVGRLPCMVAAVREAADRHGVRVATALHAGDGNLHPGVMYDAADPDSSRRAHAAAEAIIDAALGLGGTITGEHGVGVEKLHALPRQLHPVALDLMRGVRGVFDPRGLCNPGKLLPEETGTAPLPPAPAVAAFDADALAVRTPASATVAEVRRVAGERGLTVPGADGPGDLPIGHVFDAQHRDAGDPRGRLRDAVLEVWARTGDGRSFHAGLPVVKNVAGYDLPRLLAGTGGALADAEALTLAARPARGEGATPVPPDAEPSAIAPDHDRLAGLKALFDPHGVLPAPEALP